MKSVMKLEYLTDTEVEVTITAGLEGITVSSIDGNYKNHFTVSSEDAVEIASMLLTANKHVVEVKK